jgi:2-oxoglutarate dehydrogenase E1 component
VSSLYQQAFASSALGAPNADYVDQLYEAYLADPASVGTKWRTYFDGIRGGANEQAHGPVLRAIGEISRISGKLAAAPSSNEAPQGADPAKQAAVLRVINAYRTRGHLQAKVDPLGMAEQQAVPDLALEFHGLSDADLGTVFDAPILVGNTRRSLGDIVDMLNRTYLGSIGADYMHLTDHGQRRWLQERLEETAGNYDFSTAQRRRILNRLTAAEGLERYLHTKYVGQKRFSLEGGDSLVPLIDELIQRAGSNGAREMVIGMAHRGRLNVLINVLGKPPRELFDAFEGNHGPDDDEGYSGDVKYHLGFSSDVRTPGGNMHLALGFNPSHLEIINPVITGSVKARQIRRGDTQRDQVLPLLIHGDAAFIGQGVVPELLNMSQARGFVVGGTVHVVINNQVGFTISNPRDARSTTYCTDVARMIEAPVLHVNGDDPDAVVFCAQLALDFRQAFKKDVVIDLVCYRRHGHNEADEPAATQPLMYANIRARRSTREIYAQQLADDNVATLDESRAAVESYRKALESGKPVVAELVPTEQGPGWVADWSKFRNSEWDVPTVTGLPRAELDQISAVLHTLPTDLKLHSRVAKVYEDRSKMASGAQRMDWGFAETMAYGSLLKDGFQLRLVGQDSGRGTFFHRHAVLHDQVSGDTFMPMRRFVEQDDRAVIVDSLLSEEAVLAYEYGFATADPDTLVIWEAQFGDFVNGAQVVIDQFISSGEAKWGRLCGLTLFLPHGYEGQGPEHSSARLERFLQLCALNNLQVCVPTTPAQMFHMLRRQMLRRYRKPLVVMTPKSMLRLKHSTSTLEELESGRFEVVLADTLAADPSAVRRVVFCAGKVYYDLLEEVSKRAVRDVAVVRVEQLYPFPRPEVTAELARFANANDLVWCQEEPQNQGAWFQIRHHLEACLGAQHTLSYAGRERSPAPACGHLDMHMREQAALVQEALN